ncbi:MAG: hypothetical protein WBB23_11765 [Desulforhopalus sp.]
MAHYTDAIRQLLEGGIAIEAFYSYVAGKPYDKDSSEFAVMAKRA